MGVTVADRIVEKIIALLKANTFVTNYTGSGASARIYGSHLSTIQDFVLPAVTIHIIPGEGRQTSGSFSDSLQFQIEPWMYGVGKNAFVWDDVIDCYGAIVDSLHRIKGWDTTIGIKIFEITQLSKGPALQDPDGVMHFPSRWKVLATT